MDLFFLHIQGSGKINLHSGETIHVHYHTTNGQPYRSIGKLLIDEEKISVEEMSMQKIREYLHNHPEEMDSVLNYNPNSGKITTKSIDEAMEFINNENIKIHYILESHAHADHLTGSQKLKELNPGAKIGIGEKIKVVQETFKGFFNLKDLKTDGSQFDILLEKRLSSVAGLMCIMLYGKSQIKFDSAFGGGNRLLYW